jgi:hypothetical protein
MWEGPYFARAVANVISAAVLNRSLALSHNWRLPCVDHHFFVVLLTMINAIQEYELIW